MSLVLPPGKPTKRPFSAAVPAPLTSSHQARCLGSWMGLISQRPLNCSSPAKAGGARRSKNRESVCIDFLLNVSEKWMLDVESWMLVGVRIFHRDDVPTLVETWSVPWP